VAAGVFGNWRGRSTRSSMSAPLSLSQQGIDAEEGIGCHTLGYRYARRGYQRKNEAGAHYALDGLPNNVMAAEYRTALPDERSLAEEIERTRLALEARTTMSE
jgi:hypothetical protein